MRITISTIRKASQYMNVEASLIINGFCLSVEQFIYSHFSCWFSARLHATHLSLPGTLPCQRLKC